MSAYRRLQAEMEISRRIAVQRDFELSRRIEFERLEREREYLILKDAEKLRAEQQYEEYRLRRSEQHRLIQSQMVQERLEREARVKEYEIQNQLQRRAREVREHELEVQQRLAVEDQARRGQALAASRRVEHQRKQKAQADMQRQNVAVLDEQNQQQKLEQQLADIEIALGTIFDNRESRKRRQLEQLQELDKRSFKLKQSMRSSKVKQKALQESLAELSKLIV